MVMAMSTRLGRQKFLLFFFCLLASSFVGAANTPAPRATVDRTIVSEGDSITLTIRIDSSRSSDAPDYSTLEKDFEVYSAGSSSQTGYSNGKFFSSVEHRVTLIPKRSGQLQIPPLNVAGAQTQPITIQVNPQSQTNAVDSGEPVFVEVQIDHNNVYVQQQVLLTARVYVAVQLNNMQLSKPEFDNATVKQLSETTFNRNINGMPYEVHELIYAIFPQQPGELTIPELVFNAVEIVGGRSMFDFAGRGRAIRKISNQLSVQVKPIPKNFTGSVWLPARNLTLTESWSGDQQHLAIGDSITRSITIRADGLLAAQLPKLEQPQLDSAKLYADQPKLDDAADSAGVHGKRVENSALIPNRTGALQLPETRVVWWDIDSDSEKVATLPGETLTIVAGANAVTAPPTSQSVTSLQPPATPSPTAETVPTALIKPTNAALWWQIATAVLALLWVATLLAYLQLRGRPRIAAINSAVNIDDHDEKAAWRNFADACRANNPTAARQQLLQWAAQFYRDENVRSIEQLQHVANNPLLLRELQLLDNRLFGTLRDSGDWNGENLLQVIQEMKKHSARKNRHSGEALPPLYPAA